MLSVTNGKFLFFYGQVIVWTVLPPSFVFSSMVLSDTPVKIKGFSKLRNKTLLPHSSSIKVALNYTLSPLENLTLTVPCLVGLLHITLPLQTTTVCASAAALVS